MPKFEALMEMRTLVVPFIERDEKGQLIRDQAITFKQGMNTPNGVVPAYLITENEQEVKYLREYPGNEQNGGMSFKELKEAAKEKPKKTVLKVETEEPLEESEETAETVESGDSETVVYGEVTTRQQAFAILKSLDPTVNTANTRTIEDMQKKAASLNVSFPNL